MAFSAGRCFMQLCPPRSVEEPLLSRLAEDHRLHQAAAVATCNALPNFTNIDGLDIHFIHARSKHENALPMIVTHGWPGSVIEQLKIIEPLTNPTVHIALSSAVRTTDSG